MKAAIRTTAGRGRLFDSILDTVGDTPTIRINNLGVGHATIYVKAEFFNPAGSVKDRLALNIIEDAERRGLLKPGQTVVEATSGNTGIGLAIVCAQKGYPLVVTMADSFSIERRKLMRMLGAKVVLTPRALKGYGMYRKAVELAEANGWFLARQFETEANADIHEMTTAREIVNDFAGSRLDFFVTGYGTGGTIAGVGRVLRRERPETRIILSEPANAQLLGSGHAQERGVGGAPSRVTPTEDLVTSIGRGTTTVEDWRSNDRQDTPDGGCDRLSAVAGFGCARDGRRAKQRRHRQRNHRRINPLQQHAGHVRGDD
jgi:cysteine synthase